MVSRGLSIFSLGVWMSRECTFGCLASWDPVANPPVAVFRLLTAEDWWGVGSTHPSFPETRCSRF